MLVALQEIPCGNEQFINLHRSQRLFLGAPLMSSGDKLINVTFTVLTADRGTKPQQQGQTSYKPNQLLDRLHTCLLPKNVNAPLV